MATFKWDYKKKNQKTTMTGIHKKVIASLQERNIKIEVEKEFPPYSVDIYLTDTNSVIECDGGKWHNYPYGSHKDKKRDKYLVNKCKIQKVFRIWGCDIDNNDKLDLILDGILNNNLIPKLKKNNYIIAKVQDKNYKGVIKKINKLSYTAYLFTPNLNITIDNKGLFKVKDKWYRVVFYNKANLIPIWCSSIVGLIKNVLKNKNIEESQKLITNIKGFIQDK